MADPNDVDAYLQSLGITPSTGGGTTTKPATTGPAPPPLTPALQQAGFVLAPDGRTAYSPTFRASTARDAVPGAKVFVQNGGWTNPQPATADELRLALSQRGNVPAPAATVTPGATGPATQPATGGQPAPSQGTTSPVPLTQRLYTPERNLNQVILSNGRYANPDFQFGSRPFDATVTPPGYFTPQTLTYGMQGTSAPPVPLARAAPASAPVPGYAPLPAVPQNINPTGGVGGQTYGLPSPIQQVSGQVSTAPAGGQLPAAGGIDLSAYRGQWLPDGSAWFPIQGGKTLDPGMVDLISRTWSDRPQDIPQMLGIAARESGGNPAAVGVNGPQTGAPGTRDAGVFQINELNWPSLGLTAQSVLNPDTNVAAARTLYDRSQGAGPWGGADIYNPRGYPWAQGLERGTPPVGALGPVGGTPVTGQAAQGFTPSPLNDNLNRGGPITNPTTGVVPVQPLAGPGATLNAQGTKGTTGDMWQNMIQGAQGLLNPTAKYNPLTDPLAQHLSTGTTGPFLESGAAAPVNQVPGGAAAGLAPAPAQPNLRTLNLNGPQTVTYNLPNGAGGGYNPLTILQGFQRNGTGNYAQDAMMAKQLMDAQSSLMSAGLGPLAARDAILAPQRQDALPIGGTTWVQNGANPEQMQRTDAGYYFSPGGQTITPGGSPTTSGYQEMPFGSGGAYGDQPRFFAGGGSFLRGNQNGPVDSFALQRAIMDLQRNQTGYVPREDMRGYQPRPFANGGSFMTTVPTLFPMAGGGQAVTSEYGQPEMVSERGNRVTVTPMATGGSFDYAPNDSRPTPPPTNDTWTNPFQMMGQGTGPLPNYVPGMPLPEVGPARWGQYVSDANSLQSPQSGAGGGYITMNPDGSGYWTPGPAVPMATGGSFTMPRPTTTLEDGSPVPPPADAPTDTGIGTGPGTTSPEFPAPPAEPAPTTPAAPTLAPQPAVDPNQYASGLGTSQELANQIELGRQQQMRDVYAPYYRAAGVPAPIGISSRERPDNLAPGQYWQPIDYTNQIQQLQARLAALGPGAAGVWNPLQPGDLTDQIDRDYRAWAAAGGMDQPGHPFRELDPNWTAEQMRLNEVQGRQHMEALDLLNQIQNLRAQQPSPFQLPGGQTTQPFAGPQAFQDVVDRTPTQPGATLAALGQDVQTGQWSPQSSDKLVQLATSGADPNGLQALVQQLNAGRAIPPGLNPQAYKNPVAAAAAMKFTG